MLRRTLTVGISAAAAAFGLYACGGNSGSDNSSQSVQNRLVTATPIKHVVVIYNENVSFDHYFATYPNAANPQASRAFTAAAGTRRGQWPFAGAAHSNPNFTNPANGAAASNPFRLDRTQAATSDQNHAYTAEQQAYDNGAADLFPKYTGKGTAAALALSVRLAR